MSCNGAVIPSRGWRPLFIFALLASGCTPGIYVVDERGAPLEGAAVHVASGSFLGDEVRTDGDGFVRLPRGIQPWAWVTVSKAGYSTVQVELGPVPPARVVLPPGRAMIMEYLDEKGDVSAVLFMDPGTVLGVENWLKFFYREPPPRNEIGSVFPRAAVLTSPPGDLQFKHPPDQVRVLYQYLSARGDKEFISGAALDRLIGLAANGTPYTGPVMSGKLRWKK